MDKPMSNKEVAIYMIPACCVFAAAITLESKTWLSIVFLIVAGIVVFAKKKIPTRRQAKVGIQMDKRLSRAHCSTSKTRYGRKK